MNAARPIVPPRVQPTYSAVHSGHPSSSASLLKVTPCHALSFCLQPTYSAVHSGRSSYSDSRSGAGSEERQPLLYSVGGQAARWVLQCAGWGRRKACVRGSASLPTLGEEQCRF